MFQSLAIFIAGTSILVTSIDAEEELSTLDDLDDDASCDSAVLGAPPPYISLLQRHATALTAVQSLTLRSHSMVTSAASSNESHIKVLPDTLGCVYYGSIGDKPMTPFSYWAPTTNATVWASGPYLKPEASPSGLCYFPSAQCGVNRCCTASATSTSLFHSYSNWNTWLCFGVWMFYNAIKDRLEAPRNGPPGWGPQAASGAPAQGMLTTASGAPGEGLTSGELPNSMMFQSAWKKFFNIMAMSLGIGISIFVSIYIAASAQTSLNVQQRNSMLAADAWITPIGCVFQFLEDAMTVKISFSMAAGDKRRVKALLMVGVLGGLACGIVAAGLLTVLSFTSFLQTLLVPYDVAATGCPLIPTALQIVDDSRAYWLLNSWCFPFSFITLVFTGFILGSMEFGLYGIAMAASQGVLAAIWFGLKPTNGTSPGLALLGWANLCSSVTFVVICFLGIALNPDLCERYDLSFFASSVAEKKQEEPEESSYDLFCSVGKEAATQGGSAMILDLCVQVNYTAGVYMSGVIGADTMYQISAMQSAMPMFGTAWAIGLSYGTKIGGGSMVALGKFQEFAVFLRNNVLICIWFGVVTVATTFPAREALSFYFAQPACVYASNPQCLATYSGIFGGSAMVQGDTTLQEAFGVFSFAAAATCLFTGLKAGLYCCFDFDFMAKCGLLSTLIFVPSVCVAFLHFHNSVAMYAAMYIPTLTLGTAFAVRLFQNKEKMVNGTWTMKERFSAQPS